MSWQRGDVVVCVLAGDYGKPRPAIVVQSNLFNPTHASVTVCPITSEKCAAPLFRLPLRAGRHGLRQTSWIMADKITAIRRERIRRKIGSLEALETRALDEALQRWLSLD
ncbi:MAG: type II toxin-antitoxin system PemK/MazF family toxin [Verrucomicrobia bacterium]|jgi:mRNA interferase MazF|nr:type II toxin-antitoxin system PemK/MazF family toxin [Verrucomicrobiota bacterium]